MNLSGLENRFDALLREGVSPEDCARFVFDCVGKAVETVLAPYKGQPVLFMGGVASSRILKERFSSWGECYFSSAATSCDNALGIAALTAKRFLN